MKDFKTKLITAIAALMVIAPWTIFPIRTQGWALEMPAAAIIIACYALFMVFSGIFTIFSYTKKQIHNPVMQICLVINSLYAAGGAVILCTMALQR